MRRRAKKNEHKVRVTEIDLGTQVAGVTGIEGLPPEAIEAIGRLPEQFRSALGMAPPEAIEALKAFGDQRHVDTPDALADLGTFAEMSVDGVEVSEPQTFVFSSVHVTGGPDHAFEVRFDRESYGPGDRVAGTIVARRAVKAVDLNVDLAYCEQSPEFGEHTSVDTAERVHTGTLEHGTELRFSLALPSDALPNWDPGGVAAALGGGGTHRMAGDAGDVSLARYGRLFWGIVVTATRRGVVPDTVERHPIPVVDDPSRWPGPASTPELEPIGERVKGWDVDLDISDRTPRRGGTVHVDVVVGQPGRARGELKVGVVCEIHYDLQTSSTDNSGHSTKSRTTRIAIAHEDWQILDTGTRMHQIRIPIPDHLPFSYGRAKAKKVGGFTWTSGARSSTKFGGTAYAVRWVVIVSEDRRARRDPRRDAVIHVRP